MVTSHAVVPGYGLSLSECWLRGPSTSTIEEDGTLSASGYADAPLVLTAFRTYPEWLDDFIERLNNLLELPKNWDTYGAEPVKREAVSDAVRLAVNLLQYDLGAGPTVVPTPSGGLQLEWHRRGMDLELEFEGNGLLQVLVATVEGEEERVVELDRAVELLPVLRTVASEPEID